jgi:cobalt/nickel transport system ATP-binding protein
MLDGLIFPDSGVIRAFGSELAEADFDDENFSRDFRKKVGFVFQNPDIQLFCPTVKEDIIFGPSALGVEHEEIKIRLAKIAALFGIEHLLERSPHQLSVGEKRKSAIATMLAIEPEVMILDEPTAGLDPLTTRHIIDMILEAGGKGKTVITATHDLHIVAEISDTVHVFDQTKKIIKSGSPDEILTDQDFLVRNNLTHIHKHAHNGVIHAHPHSHLDHHSQ